jgi:hypothetical protein
MIKIFLKKLDELSIELHNYELNELKKIIEKKMKKKSFPPWRIEPSHTFQED